jgi:hypothetical protein
MLYVIVRASDGAVERKGKENFLYECGSGIASKKIPSTRMKVPYTLYMYRRSVL